MVDMSKVKIFVVEDNDYYRKLLEYHLALIPDNQVTGFATGAELLSNLDKAPDIVTLDFSLPDFTGHDLLKKIRAKYPSLPVIVISEQKDLKTAVQLLREGAYEYLLKDDETRDHLLHTVQNIKAKLVLQREIQELRTQLNNHKQTSRNILGSSPTIKNVFDLITKASASNITVSISGESGTGKEMVGRAIHAHSNVAEQPFVAVNISAIPIGLMESELFGFEQDSITRASEKRIGKFEEANGGTLFLDEIGEADLNLQAKLLRVLQDRELTRIGGNQVVKLNIRIIVATNKDLAEEVRKGNFREDLYYRLLGLPIHLPPLRERGNDILLLAKYFVDEFTKANKHTPLAISFAARDKLLEYSFPGNVRELKAVMELGCVLANGEEITSDDIVFNSVRHEAALLLKEMSLKDHTRMIIDYYLQKYNHDVLLVAEKLEIGKSTIYKMKQNGEL